MAPRWVAGAQTKQGGSTSRHQAEGPVRDRRRWGVWWPAVDRHSLAAAPAARQPLGILTSAAVVWREGPGGPGEEAVSHVGVEGVDLGRRHAARVRGALQWRGALRGDRR